MNMMKGNTLYYTVKLYHIDLCKGCRKIKQIIFIENQIQILEDFQPEIINILLLLDWYLITTIKFIKHICSKTTT